MRINCYMCKCKLDDGEQVYSIKTKLKDGSLAFLGVICEYCNKRYSKSLEEGVPNEEV